MTAGRAFRPDATDGAGTGADLARGEPRSPGVLLIRHRRSTYNDEGRWTGRHDPPLSPRGVEEAERVRRGLASWALDAAVTSDLARARQTADIVLAGHPSVRPVPDARLGELDTPAWAGLTRDEIEQLFPGALDGWRDGTRRDLPGAEAWAAFVARVEEGLTGAAARGARVLVVAHAGVLRAAGEAFGSAHGKVPRSRGLWLSSGAGSRLVAGPQHRLHTD